MYQLMSGRTLSKIGIRVNRDIATMSRIVNKIEKRMKEEKSYKGRILQYYNNAIAQALYLIICGNLGVYMDRLNKYQFGYDRPLSLWLSKPWVSEVVIPFTRITRTVAWDTKPAFCKVGN